MAKDRPKAATKSTGGKRAEYRAASRAKRKAYYSAQPMQTATNKKKKLRRHIRLFPEDLFAVRAYEGHLNFGNTRDLGVRARATRRGERRKRFFARERRRLERAEQRRRALEEASK